MHGPTAAMIRSGLTRKRLQRLTPAIMARLRRAAPARVDGRDGAGPCRPRAGPARNRRLERRSPAEGSLLTMTSASGSGPRRRPIAGGDGDAGAVDLAHHEESRPGRRAGVARRRRSTRCVIAAQRQVLRREEVRPPARRAAAPQDARPTVLASTRKRR